MLFSRRFWPGEIWCGSARSTKQTGGQVSIGCCWFQSCLLHTHTHIYMYSTGVWAEINTVNLHTFNAIAFYCSHSHRPQCRYITGPQDIYIYIFRDTRTTFALLTVFLLPKPKCLLRVLWHISAFSRPGDTGCSGNWQARDREGREGSFSLFPDFLGKTIFPSTY